MTPETDDIAACLDKDFKSEAIKRVLKLETERDLARATCLELTTCSDALKLAESLAKASIERDEASRQLADAQRVTNSQRDEIVNDREALNQLRAELAQAKKNHISCPTCHHIAWTPNSSDESDERCEVCRLRAELDEAKQDQIEFISFKNGCFDLEKERDQLKATVEKLKKDGERLESKLGAADDFIESCRHHHGNHSSNDSWWFDYELLEKYTAITAIQEGA